MTFGGQPQFSSFTVHTVMTFQLLLPGKSPFLCRIFFFFLGGGLGFGGGEEEEIFGFEWFTVT